MLVLVEKTNSGYRASSGKPLEAETVGPTRDEALRLLRELLTDRLQGTVEVVDMEIPGELPRSDNPWLRFHGALDKDPTFDEWQSVIAKNRTIEDEDEDAGIFPARNS